MSPISLAGCCAGAPKATPSRAASASRAALSSPCALAPNRRDAGLTRKRSKQRPLRPRSLVERDICRVWLWRATSDRVLGHCDPPGRPPAKGREFRGEAISGTSSPRPARLLRRLSNDLIFAHESVSHGYPGLPARSARVAGQALFLKHGAPAAGRGRYRHRPCSRRWDACRPFRLAWRGRQCCSVATAKFRTT